MRVDMTLASGWPYGGPHVPVDQAAGQLRVVTTMLLLESNRSRCLRWTTDESLIAVFAGAGTAKNYDADKLQRIMEELSTGTSFAKG